MARKAALKHDAQGFLVGDPVDLDKLLTIWSGIRNDIRAIRSAVLGIKNPTNQAETQPNVATPRRREAGLTRAASAESPQPAAQPKLKAWSPHAPLSAAMPKQSQAAQPVRAASGLKSDGKAATAQKDATQTVSPRGRAQRDDRGRFIAEPKDRQMLSAHSRNDDSHDRDESLLRSVGERVVNTVKETGQGLEEADPAVKAFNEIAQPMMRGFEALTGGNQQKRHNRWLRRIWQTLTGSRKEQGLFNKIAAKRLKAIEEKPVAESGGGGFLTGLMGILGALFAKIPGLKHLLPAAAAMKTGAAAGTVAGAAGNPPQTGKKPGRMGRLLHRVPFLSALIGGASMAAEVYASETDDTQSREQKDRRAGKSVGGFAGSMAGMLGGAKLGALAGAVGGPIGAAIGGVVGGAVGLFLGDEAGQIVGDKMGGWVSALRQADIPGMISRAWEGAVSFVKSGWDTVKEAGLGAWEWMKSGWEGVTGAISSGWESLKDGMKSAFGSTLAVMNKGWSATKEFVAEKADAANTAIREAIGIDVKEGAQQALSYVGDAATTAGNAVVSAGRVVVDKAVEIKDKAVALGTQAADSAQRGATSVWEGAKSAGNWILGQTSKIFESGKGGAGTVSSGKGDYGGASYGTYQLSSTQGTLQKFLAQSKYGEQFAGLKPGSPEFNAKWKEVAKNDPEFDSAQHGFIKETHYDPAMNGLKGFGIDLSQRGAAVQDAIWSSSVQFGAGNGKRGAIGMFRKALADRDIAAMSDKDIVTAIQDYKIANNDRLFASSSADVQAGTAKRAVAEKERLVALAEIQTQQQPAPAQAQHAALPSDKPQPSILVNAPVAAQAVSPIETNLALPAAPVVASASAPTVPAAPVVPLVSDTPPVSVPLSGNDTGRSVSVVTIPADVGQDVRERGIAHIVTGGLAR